LFKHILSSVLAVLVLPKYIMHNIKSKELVAFHRHGFTR